MRDVGFKEMKHITLILLAAAVLSGCGGKKPLPASRLEQSTGRFSYMTPDGWFRTKLPGIPFVIVSAEADFGAEPNIFVDSVEASAQLSNVVSRVISRHLKQHPSYTVSEQRDFNTDSGLSGIKISAGRANKDKLPLATLHYLFQDSDRIIAITCTCADPVKHKYEPLFDAAMKSLVTED